MYIYLNLRVLLIYKTHKKQETKVGVWESKVIQNFTVLVGKSFKGMEYQIIWNV